MANSVLAKMAVQISANTAEFNKALQSTSNNLKNFTTGIQNIAAQVGIAFGTQQIAQFGLEVAKLSGEAEAVRIAFERLPNSIRLMNQLKDATGGTVSELELMKRAVQASNFDISLEALPRLLEFATLRAQQTGQSVDYLVDSIVTGIGRKSKLILDNLGISAAQLSEELKGVSTDAASVGDVADAVGRIAEKNLANMAGFAENASTKLQRLAASWENLKVKIGDAINSGGVTGGVIDTITNLFDIFSSDNLSKVQKFQTYLVAALNPQNLSGFTSALKALDDEMDRNNQLAEEAQNRINRYDAQLLINKYNGIQAALEGFTTAFNDLNNVDMSTLSETELRQFANYEAILKIIQSRLNEVTKEQQNAIDTISEYEAAIKSLNEENSNLTLADSAKIISNKQLIKQYEAEIEVLKRLGEERLKSVSVPGFGSALSKAKLPGFKEKEDIRNQGFLAGVGELVPPDISRFEETTNSILSLNQMLSDSFISLGEDILFAFGAGNQDNNLGKNLLMSLARFGSMYGKQLIAIGIAKKAEGIVTNNPVAVAKGASAVLAGAALIAGSAILGGVASSMGSGGSGGAAGSGGSGFNSRATIGAVQSEQRIVVEGIIWGKDIKIAYDSATQDNRIRRG